MLANENLSKLAFFLENIIYRGVSNAAAPPHPPFILEMVAKTLETPHITEFTLVQLNKKHILESTHVEHIDSRQVNVLSHTFTCAGRRVESQLLKIFQNKSSVTGNTAVPVFALIRL